MVNVRHGALLVACQSPEQTPAESTTAVLNISLQRAKRSQRRLEDRLTQERKARSNEATQRKRAESRLKDALKKLDSLKRDLAGAKHTTDTQAQWAAKWRKQFEDLQRQLKRSRTGRTTSARLQRDLSTAKRKVSSLERTVRTLQSKAKKQSGSEPRVLRFGPSEGRAGTPANVNIEIECDGDVHIHFHGHTAPKVQVNRTPVRQPARRFQRREPKRQRSNKENGAGAPRKKAKIH